MTTLAGERSAVGALLRQWREHRRLSQLELSVRAEVSTRHLSFVETSRARPSRQMVLHLAEHLELPLRERNRLLLAAGYAPVFEEHPMDAPEMAAVRAALRQVLSGHEPYPALVVDRDWNLVEANSAAGLFLADVAAELLGPPVNVLRATLHPDGMAPKIGNLGQCRAHLLGRLRREVAATGSASLRELYEEVTGYPGEDCPEVEIPGAGEVVVPLNYSYQGVTLSFFSTIATFGTAVDVTLSEISIESFFPADRVTADFLHERR